MTEGGINNNKNTFKQFPKINHNNFVSKMNSKNTKNYFEGFSFTFIEIHIK